MLFNGVGDPGFQNGIIDFSNVATVDADLLKIAGPDWAAADSLTADIIAPDDTLSIADTSGYAVDDVLVLSSAGAWDAAGTLQGDICQIASIPNGTTIVLKSPVRGRFLVAASAKIQKFDTSCRPTFRNLELIGGGVAAGQQGIVIDRCGLTILHGNKIRAVGGRGIAFWRSYLGLISQTSVEYADLEGEGYALSTSGSHGVVVDGVMADNCRHAFTSGRFTIPARDQIIRNVMVKEGRDAAVDTHPGADRILIDGVRGTLKLGNASDDGLMMQGSRCVVRNVELTGAISGGAVIQWYGGDDPSCDNYMNYENIDLRFNKNGGTAGAFTAKNLSGGVAILDKIRLAGFRSNGNRGIYLSPESGDIGRVDIVDCDVVAADYPAFYVESKAAYKVDTINVAKSRFETTSANTNHYALQLTGADWEAAHPGEHGVVAEFVDCEFVGGASYNARVNDARATLINSKQSGFGTKNVHIDGIGECDIAVPILRKKTVAAATYTVDTYRNLTVSYASTTTLTLPSAAANYGRRILVRTTQSAVVSASANVIPRAGGAAGTAILAATPGSWAEMVSNGTAWVIERGA